MLKHTLLTLTIFAFALHSLTEPAHAQISEFKITVSDGAANDFFRESVSISGDYAVVGAPFDDANGADAGSAYVYNVSGSPFVANPIQDIVADEDFGSILVALLDTVFDDPDLPNDSLRYVVSVSSGLINASITGDSLWLFSITDSNGVTNVVVTATDDSSLSVSDSFVVTVLPVEDDPSGFTLTFPLGDTLNTLLPIFTWNPSVDPDMGDLIEYQLMISESESMGSPVYTAILADTSHTISVPLTDDIKYYWAVSARDTTVEARIDYTTEIEPIFTNNCTSVSCHVPGNTGGGLNLQVGASFDEITGSATTFHAPLVIADNPDISPLIWKLEGVDDNGDPVFGSRMPLGGLPLSQSTIDLIRDWISEGANETVVDSSGQFSYSDTSSFLLDKQESPLAFSLISPEDESSLDSLRPLFSWDQSIDPDPRDEVKYTLIIRKLTDPDSVVYKVEGLGDTMHQITEDIEIGSYQWLVIAEDADDNNLDTESSEIFSLNVVVGINDEIAGIPEEYDLNQNYPNPFNPTTTIEYSLPQSGDVSLIVYNLLGREVAKLVNGKLDAGYHEVTWDASNMASGVYIYRLKVAGRRSASPTFIRTKKMVLLK